MDLILDNSYTEVDKESHVFFYGKSNHNVIFENITRNGVINLDYYRV